MSIKLPKNDFTKKFKDFDTFTKICERMWAIWANQLSPKALQSCLEYNKSPNLVTLLPTYGSTDYEACESNVIQRYGSK